MRDQPEEATLKAAVCHAFGQPLTIEEVQLESPGDGEVRVALHACGVCHSDIHFIEGAWGGALPAVFGHEGAGVVEAVGPGVTGLAPGDSVVVGLMRFCGTCAHCTRDETYLCATQFPLDRERRLHDGNGGALLQGLRTGAFAEAVVVEQSQVVPVPADLPMTSAALLPCGVLTGWGAVVRVAQVPAGATVGVIGIGGVGINAVQAAALQDAARVVALDTAPEKLALAAAFGATDSIDPLREDAAERIAAITGGLGLDYLLVTVGSGRLVGEGLALLRRGGTLVLVGMPASGDVSTLHAGDLAGDAKRILGSKMGGTNARRDIPHLVDLYGQGRFRLDALVSGRYPLARINEAVAATKGGAALRNVIVFDAAGGQA